MFMLLTWKKPLHSGNPAQNRPAVLYGVCVSIVFVYGKTGVHVEHCNFANLYMIHMRLKKAHAEGEDQAKWHGCIITHADVHHMSMHMEDGTR